MNPFYDAMGQRIAKTVTNKNTIDGTDKFVTTYYVRDPQGNVLAVYERKRGETGDGTFTLTEQHLYGAGRLGMRKRDLALNATNASETPATYYELTNHLGNVMAVISDKASDTNEPTVVSLSDYYPFGMTEPGRSWNAGDYRFGYTGHEKENDLAEGVYTTEYRLLDTRLGRWMSVDPLFANYADMSSYNYCLNNPMVFFDSDGRLVLMPSRQDPEFTSDHVTNAELFKKLHDSRKMTSLFTHGDENIIRINGSDEMTPDGVYNYLKENSPVFNKKTEKIRKTGITSIVLFHICSTGKGDKFNIQERCSRDSKFKNALIVAPTEVLWADKSPKEYKCEIKSNSGKVGRWNFYLNGELIATMEGTSVPNYRNIRKVVKEYFKKKRKEEKAQKTVQETAETKEMKNVDK